jgi:putative salt-induced outer membrane protein YdiY
MLKPRLGPILYDDGHFDHLESRQNALQKDSVFGLGYSRLNLFGPLVGHGCRNCQKINRAGRNLIDDI